MQAPSTRDLQAFMAIAEELSFRRAAERLFLDQSALSRRVQNLEDLLGFRLIFRTTREVELTEAGRELLARAMHLAMATEQQICQGFDVDQREHLISMLEIVAANLELAKGVHPDTDN